MRNSLPLVISKTYTPAYQSGYSDNKEELRTEVLEHGTDELGQDTSRPIVIGDNLKSDFRFKDYKENVGNFQTGYLYEIYYKLSVACPMILKVHLSRSSSTYSDKMWVLLLYKNGSYKLIDYTDDLTIELDTDVDYIVIEGANDIYNDASEEGNINIDLQGTVIF